MSNLSIKRNLFQLMVSFFLTFISGFAYEFCSVLWVHQATHGSALSTALVSGVQALSAIIGIGNSVQDWKAAPFYVVGYALGAYVSMLWA